MSFFQVLLLMVSSTHCVRGVEGRRRSCVTVPFSLPTLGVLGRMCCEDFEMCWKIFKCVVKISEFVVNLKCVSRNLECVVHNLKCILNNSKCVVR